MTEKRYKVKSEKGKVPGVEWRGSQLLELSPSVVTQDILNFSPKVMITHMLSTKETQRLSTQSFIGDWSCSNLLSRTQQNFRLPQKKQVVSINQIIYIVYEQ